MIRNLSLFILLIGLKSNLFAQRIESITEMQNESTENIVVEKLDDDDRATTFVIWVDESVREHYHAEHTEVVYVVEGSGIMTLGESTREVKPGDYIFIPKGTHHSVQVNDGDRMKVISIQTPHFDGSDRVFVDQE